MGGLGAPEQSAQLLALPTGAQGQFSLRLEPQDLVVPEGGSISVNCSTDCPDAQHVTLETSLPKEPLSSGLGWAAFRLSNVTHDDREVLCSSFCNGLQIAGSFGITVYREWMWSEVGTSLRQWAGG